MTCAFSTYFVLVWLTGVLTIPAAVALAVISIVWSGEDEWRVAFASLALLSLLWALYLRGHSQRVLIRSGAWPNLCRGDYTPVPLQNDSETLAEIKYRLKLFQTKWGRPPQVVGGGWGYFLQRAGPAGPRIFLHNFTGPTGKSRTWYSGTTIASVNKDLQKLPVKSTLSSHPTMDYISIGSWFAMGNHGNQGDAGLSNYEVFEEARVLDMTSPDTVYVVKSYKSLRNMFDDKEKAGSYCVIDITFSSACIKKDEMIQKRGYVVDSPLVAGQWLRPGAYLRVIFMGAARSNAIGLRWEDEYTPESNHVDPHGPLGLPALLCCNSRMTQYCQVDICSVCCGCIEGMDVFDGRTLLSNANKWMPYVFAMETIAVVLSGIINFEIIFKLDEGLTGNVLWRIVQEVTAMHYMHGGRSELRYSASKEYNLIYLDIAMRKRGFQEPFKMLKHSFGVSNVSLHPGKFNKLSTAPCTRMTLTDLVQSNGV